MKSVKSMADVTKVFVCRSVCVSTCRERKTLVPNILLLEIFFYSSFLRGCSAQGQIGISKAQNYSWLAVVLLFSNTFFFYLKLQNVFSCVNINLFLENIYERSIIPYQPCLRYFTAWLMNYLLKVPDNAGSINAGSDALFVVRLDFQTGDGGFVLFHDLHQPMAMWQQLPNTYLQTSNTFYLHCKTFASNFSPAQKTNQSQQRAGPTSWVYHVSLCFMDWLMDLDVFTSHTHYELLKICIDRLTEVTERHKT